jgi:two-component system nitrogen regulation response regulator NtrX
VDVRLVCATHKNIEELVARGKFRQDLWYRISAFIIRVPSLSERKEDIPALAEHFLELTAVDMGITKQFTAGALNALQKMELPGNVRELRHLVARLSVYSSGDTIDVNDINAVNAGHPATGSPSGPEAGKYHSLEFKAAREEFEKDYLKAVLKKNQGNITATANAIGMAQSNLSRKLKELRLR